MNIDELKIIIDLVREVSNDATSIAVWWIAGQYAFSLLKTLIICGTIFIALRFVAQVISANMQWAEAARAVARVYGGEGGNVFYGTDQQALRKAALAGLKETND